MLGVLALSIPEQTPKDKALSVLSQLPRQLDLIGFALFAPAVIQLLLALQYGGNQYPWDSPQTIGLFCGAGATFLAWFFWNRRKGSTALLPPSMISRRTVWTAAMFNAFEFVAMYGTLYYLPVYFQSIDDASAIMSGVYIMPMFLPQLVTASIAGGVCKSFHISLVHILN